MNTCMQETSADERLHAKDAHVKILADGVWNYTIRAGMCRMYCKRMTVHDMENSKTALGPFALANHAVSA